MGAEASTMRAPMTAVDIKNKIGVLFEGEISEAFKAAASEGPNGDVVSWAMILAYLEENGKQFLLDPKYSLFYNLKAFQKARDEIEKIARREIKGAIKEIPWQGEALGDEWRQNGPEGSPAETLDELYEVAVLACQIYSEIMTEACKAGGVQLNMAPLKGRARAEAKAHNEYNNKTAPCYSWLFDIVRASVMCMTEDEIVALYRKLEADPRVIFVRMKNRFNPALFNGYRDLLINVAVAVETASGTTVKHLCELQVHLAAIKDSEPLHLSHITYEFFRDFFLGNTGAVEQRLKMLCDLPIVDAANVDDLVDHILSSDKAEDTVMLENLCELMESISEIKNIVRIREHILSFMERDVGHDQGEVADALVNLGRAYYNLCDYNKALDYLERALAIQEREYDRDHVLVAATLVHLGNAYYFFGDNNKARDYYKRALAIQEREYGRGHVEVAVTLMQLGGAYDCLGDNTKARDYIQRALAIQEREYGRDHVKVADTLTHLGGTYDSLGDYTKARDYYERALAIHEREYGREHAEVANTLAHLGNVYGSLGDYSKERDYLERSLAIQEQEYGRDHKEVAVTLANLGQVYNSLGDYSTARDYYERALSIEEREYGHDHEEVAATLENLAVVYRNLGDYTKARAIEKRLIKNCGKRWGLDLCCFCC